jgi:hypothetical protein
VYYRVVSAEELAVGAAVVVQKIDTVDSVDMLPGACCFPSINEGEIKMLCKAGKDALDDHPTRSGYCYSLLHARSLSELHWISPDLIEIFDDFLDTES